MRKMLALLALALSTATAATADTMTALQPSKAKTVFYSTSQSDLPVFEACNRAMTNSSIAINIPLSHNDKMYSGEQFELEPGACLLLQGQKIIATASEVRAGPSARQIKRDDAQQRASNWLRERATAMQAEYDAETDPEKKKNTKVLLDEFNARLKGTEAISAAKPRAPTKEVLLSLKVIG